MEGIYFFRKYLHDYRYGKTRAFKCFGCESHSFSSIDSKLDISMYIKLRNPKMASEIR